MNKTVGFLMMIIALMLVSEFWGQRQQTNASPRVDVQRDSARAAIQAADALREAIDELQRQRKISSEAYADSLDEWQYRQRQSVELGRDANLRAQVFAGVVDSLIAGNDSTLAAAITSERESHEEEKQELRSQVQIITVDRNALALRVTTLGAIITAHEAKDERDMAALRAEQALGLAIQTQLDRRNRLGWYERGIGLIGWYCAITCS